MSWAKASPEALTDLKARLSRVAFSSGEASGIVSEAAAGAVSEVESLLARYRDQIGKALETEERAKRVVGRCLKEFQRAQSIFVETPSTVNKTDSNGASSSQENPAYGQARKEAEASKSKLEAAESLLAQCERLTKALRGEESDFQRLQRTIEEEGGRLEKALRSQAGFAENASEALGKILRVLSEYESLTL